MNERIKELAGQAGFDIEQTAYGKKVFVDGRGVTTELERFAELVRQDEREACAEHYLAIMRDAVAQAVKRAREACAKLCEQEHDNYLQDEEPDRADGAMWCAAAIRGRTE